MKLLERYCLLPGLLGPIYFRTQRHVNDCNSLRGRDGVDAALPKRHRNVPSLGC